MKSDKNSFANDIDGMNEGMASFDSESDNPANKVGQQLLFNLIKEAIKR
jgi:hypothetical protein